MTPATQQQPPRPQPPHTMAPPCRQPQVPAMGHPPPETAEEAKSIRPTSQATAMVS